MDAEATAPHADNDATTATNTDTTNTADENANSSQLSRQRAVPFFERRFASYVVGVICLAILSLWWMAFFPAISTVDSSQSWDQARDWIFQDWHPVFYTWVMAVLTRIWYSPAIVTGTQILGLCLVLASLHRRLLRIGVSGVAAFLTPIAIALSPQTGLTSMAMWKDIPFAVCVLWMFTEVLDVAGDTRRYFSSWWRVARLVAALGLVSVFRHNGKLLVAGVLVALAIAHWRHVWKRLLVAVIGVGAFYGLITGPLYSYLNAWPSPAMFSYTMFLHDMAAVVNEHEAELAPADREFLNEILPINRWKAPSASNPDGLYFCRQATPLIFPKEFYPPQRLNRDGVLVESSSLPKVLTQNSDSVFLEKHRSEFRSLWLRSLRRWPGTILGHRTCVGSMAWSPWHQNKTEIFQAPFKSTVNHEELQVKPLSQGVQRFLLRSVMRHWDTNDARWFTWRAVGWVYLAFVIVVAASIKRRSWRLLLAMATTFSAWISVVLFTPGQSARYMFPAYLCALATLPLMSLLWRRPVSTHADTRPNSNAGPDASSDPHADPHADS